MAHNTKETLQSTIDTVGHYISRIYRVVRLDGYTLRFTDHDSEITFHEGWMDGGTDALINAMVYSPTEGWNGSSMRSEAALKVANMEFKGAVGSANITDEELRAGLWDGALLDIGVVDWRVPFMGMYRHNRFRLTDFRYDEESWVAQASNLMTELQRRQGKRYGKTCWHEFMSAACGVALTPGVTHFKCTVQNPLSTAGGNRDFVAADVAGAYSGFTAQVGSFFKSGHIKWTSGKSIGQTYPVARNFPVANQVRLMYPSRAAVQIGDRFDLFAGCDKRLATCVSTSLSGGVDNHLNFGGFPNIPGTTQIAKMGDMVV